MCSSRVLPGLSDEEEIVILNAKDSHLSSFVRSLYLQMVLYTISV